MRHTCLILALSFFFCSSVAGCRHSANENDKAAAVRLSPESHAKTMQISPLEEYFNTNRLGYRGETQRFLDRIKQRHQPSELQDWALSVLDNHKDNINQFSLPRNEIPKFILQLDPPLEPSVDVQPNSSVEVVWGGGWGFWGLFIAASNSPPPYNPLIYQINWVPGIQAFHTTQ